MCLNALKSGPSQIEVQDQVVSDLLAKAGDRSLGQREPDVYSGAEARQRTRQREIGVTAEIVVVDL